MKTELYTLSDATIKTETDNAILVEVDDERIWLPFSQIEKIERHPNGSAVIVMSAWIAKQKGLI